MSASNGQPRRSMWRAGPYMVAAAVNGLRYVAKRSTEDKCPEDEWRALLAGVGLTPEEAGQHGGFVPLHKGIAAFEAAAAWPGNPNPTLAFDYAKAFLLGATGPLGFALVNARTVRDALKTLSRFLPVVVSLRYCRYEEDSVSGRVAWQHPGNEATPRLQYAAWSVALIMKRLEFPVEWKPAAVVLDVDPPPDPAPFEAHFGPGLRFARGPNWVAIQAEFLDRPMPSADPRVFELMTRLAEIDQRQRAAAGSDFESDARTALTQLLRQGEATAANLAAAMSVTPAQLRAKLKQYELDFRTLIDDVRRETARGYLRESDLSITAIAFDLGYADSSMFTRACHKWFGKSPRDVRNDALAASRGTPSPARAKPTLD